MNILDQTLWVAHTLFQRELVTGSTGNISFRENDIIYISKSGSCFGLLEETSFAKVSIDGTVLEGKPSKEFPMHISLYQKNTDIKSVVHTHSFNTTLVSCYSNLDKESVKELCDYTPYLEMQTNGKIGVVEYGKPGSKELFEKFEIVSNNETNCYILKNHGVFVSAENPLKAFYVLEEIEQSCKISVSINSNKQYSKIK